MRSRVAFIVTLIALAALALLFSYNCARLADEENEDRQEKVRDICTIFSDCSEGYDDEARARLLKSLTVSGKAEKGLVL